MIIGPNQSAIQLIVCKRKMRDFPFIILVLFACVYWSFYWGHCFSAGQVSEKRPFIPSAVISCATITLWKIFCKLLSLRRERPVSDGRDKLRPGFFLFQLGSHVPRWRTLIHWLSKKYVGKEPGDGVAAGDENQKQSVVDDRGCWWVLKSCATYRTIGACSGAECLLRFEWCLIASRFKGVGVAMMSLFWFSLCFSVMLVRSNTSFLVSCQ
jgi:hypothetical protein